MKKIITTTKDESIEVGKTCGTKCKIDKLSIVFNSEDMNKVVEKLNEVIEKQNKCQ